MSANQYRYRRVTYNLLTGIHSALMFSSRVIDRRIKIRLDISYRMHDWVDKYSRTTVKKHCILHLMRLIRWYYNRCYVIHDLVCIYYMLVVGPFIFSFINYLYQAMSNITAHMLCSNIDSFMLPKITYFIHY